MNMNEAIQWAVEQIEDALDYEYFTSDTSAHQAREALELLSGKPWSVTPRKMKRGDVVKGSDTVYWVRRIPQDQGE
jgi:hypothetical protein